MTASNVPAASGARPRRLGLYLPWAGFALLAALWSGYWFAARDRAAADLAAMGERLRAEGGELKFSRLDSRGFPMHLTLVLRDLSFRTPDGAAQVAAATLPVSYNLTRPGHVILELASPVRVTLGRESWEFGAARGVSSVRVSKGMLARFSIDAEGVTATRDGAPAAAIESLVFHVRPDRREAGAFQAALDARGWRAELAGPGGGAAPAGFATLRFAAVISLGAALRGVSPQAALTAWRDAGGRLRVEALETEIGSRRLNGDGALALDAMLRPEGTLALRAADAAGPSTLNAADGLWRLGAAPVAAAAPLISAGPDPGRNSVAGSPAPPR